MMTETPKHNFKKGDKVYSFSLTPDSLTFGRALVCAQSLEITSMGKKQGTAIYNSGGQVLQRRIYPETRLVADLDTVRLLTIAEGLPYSANLIPKQIESDRDWLQRHRHSAKPEVVARVEARIKRLESMKPTVRLWLHDGQNVIEEIYPNSSKAAALNQDSATCQYCGAQFKIAHFCPESPTNKAALSHVNGRH